MAGSKPRKNPRQSAKTNKTSIQSKGPIDQYFFPSPQSVNAPEIDAGEETCQNEDTSSTALSRSPDASLSSAKSVMTKQEAISNPTVLDAGEQLQECSQKDIH